MWLYQMNQQDWKPNRYRLDVWEGERWSWPVRKKVPRGGTPRAGDRVVFFYAKTGGDEPGFYGWALVLDWCEDQRRMYFRPVAPSDHLKMDPWWDTDAEDIADRVRGEVKRGTLWQIREEKLSARLSAGITAWLNGSAERVPVSNKRKNP
jgi:hypothetical protein